MFQVVLEENNREIFLRADGDLQMIWCRSPTRNVSLRFPSLRFELICTEAASVIYHTDSTATPGGYTEQLLDACFLSFFLFLSFSFFLSFFLSSLSFLFLSSFFLSFFLLVNNNIVKIITFWKADMETPYFSQFLFYVKIQLLLFLKWNHSGCFCSILKGQEVCSMHSGVCPEATAFER